MPYAVKWSAPSKTSLVNITIRTVSDSNSTHFTQIPNTGQKDILPDKYYPEGQYVVEIEDFKHPDQLSDESDKPFSIVATKGTIKLDADKGYGKPPLQVMFTATLSKFPSCGNILHWDYGDGSDDRVTEPCTGATTNVPLRTVTKSHTYKSDGEFTAKLSIDNYISNTITIRPDTPTPEKQIIINSPNGGEKIKRSETFSIGWGGYATPPFTINLLKGGTFFQTLTADYYSISWFTWRVPTTIPTGSDYTIEITKGASKDTSDAPFSIE